MNPNYNPVTGKFRFSVRQPVSKKQVEAMYADYQSGMSMSAVGWKHRQITGGTVREIFLNRNMALRAQPNQWKQHQANGCFAPVKWKTDREIDALIAGLDTFRVPVEMKAEWRWWTMEKRMQFIARLRKKFPSTLPAGPLSKNVTPFKYGTPAAMKLIEQANAGKPSREWAQRIFPNSEGVIYDGRLWFWCPGTGYCNGKFVPGIGRLMVHHEIYKKHVGPLPEGMTIIFRDGNKNNFDPKNFALRSMADCVRMNSIHRLPPDVKRKILARASDKHALTHSRKGRDRLEVMLKNFQTPESGLLAALQKRSER